MMPGKRVLVVEDELQGTPVLSKPFRKEELHAAMHLATQR